MWQPCELLYTCYLLTYLLTHPGSPGKRAVKRARARLYLLTGAEADADIEHVDEVAEVVESDPDGAVHVLEIMSWRSGSTVRATISVTHSTARQSRRQSSRGKYPYSEGRLQ